jgi:ATP-dependent Zn protease
VRGLLGANLEALHGLAELLLEKESLDGADIDELLEKVGTHASADSSGAVESAPN